MSAIANRIKADGLFKGCSMTIRSSENSFPFTQSTELTARFSREGAKYVRQFCLGLTRSCQSLFNRLKYIAALHHSPKNVGSLYGSRSMFAGRRCVLHECGRSY